MFNFYMPCKFITHLRKYDNVKIWKMEESLQYVKKCVTFQLLWKKIIVLVKYGGLCVQYILSFQGDFYESPYRDNMMQVFNSLQVEFSD